MQENWKGAYFRPDPTLEQEGGLETSVLSFEVYCAVRGPIEKPPLHSSPVVRSFRDYLEKHWDSVTNMVGTLGLRQEGVVLTTNLRQAALGTYGLLLLSQVLRGVKDSHVTQALRSLFSRSPAEYRDLRDCALTYLLLTGFCDTFLVAEKRAFQFTGYTPPEDVLKLMRSWKSHHEQAMLDAFLSDEYQPIPATGERSVSAYPFLVPFGRFSRMTSYTHLVACRFASELTNPKARERLASGVDMLCQAYAWHQYDTRYLGGDPLKPAVRGIRPWPEATCPDLGTTAQLYSVLGDPRVRKALWGDGPLPAAVAGMLPLLHEDLLEQFDRYLIDPAYVQYTQACQLALALLVPEPNESARLDEIEAAIGKCRTEHGLSEWSLTRLLEETIFREKADLPTHTFPRSMGRLLLDRVRPGHYAEGPLKFEDKGNRSDFVIQKTVERYQSPAFAERFDQVHGRSPSLGLIDIFAEMVNERRGHTVLDVGCGPGQYAKIFEQRGLATTVLDISKPMLELTRNRMGWPVGDARLIEGDMRRLDKYFPAGQQFDAIWCCSAIMHFPEPVAEQIIRSMTRLLKPRTGVLMVNCALRNTRLVAEDERFYAYWDNREEFTRVLDACGLRVEKAFSTDVSRNVYWEPRLTICWDSFYCTVPDMVHDEAEGILARARDMTTTAYKLIVKRFYYQHGKTPSTDVVERFARFLKPEARILDAGCGPGQYCAEFWKRKFTGVGIDLCNEMIAHAEETHTKVMGKHPDRKFRVGDMCEMDGLFEADSFDGVFCMAAFQHVPTADNFALRTLSGFARVLRPGGVLLLDVQLGRHTGFEPDGRFIQGYKSLDEVYGLLSSAGLEVLDSGRAVTTLPKRKNAFQRGVELHFCSIIARKPGGQAEASEAPKVEVRQQAHVHSRCHVHFDGTERGRNTLVLVGDKQLWLAPGYLVNLLRLAGAVYAGNPGVHSTDLAGTNPHQEIERLRVKLEPVLDCPAAEFIEWDGAGFSHLNIPRTQVSFDLEKLAKHTSKDVKDAVAAMAPRPAHRPVS